MNVLQIALIVLTVGISAFATTTSCCWCTEYGGDEDFLEHYGGPSLCENLGGGPRFEKCQQIEVFSNQCSLVKLSHQWPNIQCEPISVRFFDGRGIHGVFPQNKNTCQRLGFSLTEKEGQQERVNINELLEEEDRKYCLCVKDLQSDRCLMIQQNRGKPGTTEDNILGSTPLPPGASYCTTDVCEPLHQSERCSGPLVIP